MSLETLPATLLSAGHSLVPAYFLSRSNKKLNVRQGPIIWRIEIQQLLKEKVSLCLYKYY
jgi:hypothetical protein